MTGNTPELYWDSTYAIVMALIDQYPEQDPTQVGLHELMRCILALPGFSDDPTIVTEQGLLDILTVWYEETVSL